MNDYLSSEALGNLRFMVRAFVFFTCPEKVHLFKRKAWDKSIFIHPIQLDDCIPLVSFTSGENICTSKAEPMICD